MIEYFNETEGLHHPIITLRIIRHSFKDPKSGELTQEGQQKAKIYGSNLSPVNNIKIYTSEINRARETGDLIKNQTNSIYTPRVRELLTEKPYTDEEINRQGLNGGKWLYTKNDVFPSTKMMAANISRFILHLDKLRLKIVTPDTQTLDILAISHVPSMMFFIGQITAWQNDRESIDKEIATYLMNKFENNFFKPLEGFEIILISQQVYLLKFQDQIIYVPKSYLEEIVRDD